MVLDRRVAREHSVLAGLQGFCHEQGLTSPLVTEVIAAYLCQGLRDRPPSTKGTYHSVLRHLARSEEAKGTPRFAGSLAPSPYDAAERAQLYSVAASQRRPWRRYSATMLLALGLGAGLRASELVVAKGRDVLIDEAGVSLRVRGARQRVVTLRGYEATLLAELVGRKNAYLFHPEEASRSYPNFVNDFCRQLVASPDAAKFSAPRARSSYICDQLASGTDLSTLLGAAGIVEVESLLRYARHVPGAPRSKAALRHQLASEQS
jgi:integrase